MWGRSERQPEPPCTERWAPTPTLEPAPGPRPALQGRRCLPEELSRPPHAGHLVSSRGTVACSPRSPAQAWCAGAWDTKPSFAGAHAPPGLSALRGVVASCSGHTFPRSALEALPPAASDLCPCRHTRCCSSFLSGLFVPGRQACGAARPGWVWELEEGPSTKHFSAFKAGLRGGLGGAGHGASGEGGKDAVWRDRLKNRRGARRGAGRAKMTWRAGSALPHRQHFLGRPCPLWPQALSETRKERDGGALTSWKRAGHRRRGW